jgi:hypothetical protein
VNGPEHYAEAENVLAVLASGEHNGDPSIMASLVGIAQVHAALALAAATVVGQYGVAPRARDNSDGAWAQVLRSGARQRGGS